MIHKTRSAPSRILPLLTAAVIFAAVTGFGAYRDRTTGATLPDTVKVGLIYGSAAVQKASAASPGGLRIGIELSETFYDLFRINENAGLTVYKDTYHYASSDGLAEYDPALSTPGEQKYGPYHVQISQAFSTYPQAKAAADAATAAGVRAYPVFGAGWLAATGFYTTQTEAQNAIAGIKSKLGADLQASVLPLDYDSLKVIDPANSNDVLLLVNRGDTSVGFMIADTQKSEYIMLNNAPKYRGSILIRNRSNVLTVMNKVSVDDYLLSVVPSEIGGASPAEAIKAQAVAARTYALNRMSEGTHSADGFDLCTTVHCQTYKGYDLEYAPASPYIRQTSRQIITYDGQPALAFYFSTSGGYTESSENVWTAKLPYLTGVPDPYESKTAPYANWTVELTAAQIRSFTHSELGDILGVEIKQTTASGRAYELMITGTAGKKSYFKESTRTIFGLRSQLYTVTPVTSGGTVYVINAAQQKTSVTLNGASAVSAAGTSTLSSSNNSYTLVSAGGYSTVSGGSGTPVKYVIQGKGYGHGVGMSQMGAIGMANAGKSYAEILKHYYTGVEITTLN